MRAFLFGLLSLAGLAYLSSYIPLRVVYQLPWYVCMRLNAISSPPCVCVCACLCLCVCFSFFFCVRQAMGVVRGEAVTGASTGRMVSTGIGRPPCDSSSSTPPPRLGTSGRSSSRPRRTGSRATAMCPSISFRLWWVLRAGSSGKCWMCSVDRGLGCGVVYQV